MVCFRAVSQESISTPLSLKELKEVLIEEWGKISLETIHNLYESIPRRIEAVINAKDEPTPY